MSAAPRAPQLEPRPSAADAPRLPPTTRSLTACARRAGARGSAAAMEQVKGQLTLFDLKKVVSSKQT